MKPLSVQDAEDIIKMIEDYTGDILSAVAGKYEIYTASNGAEVRIEIRKGRYYLTISDDNFTRIFFDKITATIVERFRDLVPPEKQIYAMELDSFISTPDGNVDSAFFSIDLSSCDRRGRRS